MPARAGLRQGLARHIEARRNFGFTTRAPPISRLAGRARIATRAGFPCGVRLLANYAASGATVIRCNNRS
ncbi:MAG: hypothetical protein ACO3QT_08255 [Burkholderiaceae bacterium]